MELDLYDCPYCLTDGVLQTQEGKCPNCKAVLDEAYKQPRHVNDLEIDDTFEGVPTKRPWERKKREILLRPFKYRFFPLICGVVMLLLAPVIFVWITAAGSEYEGTYATCSSEVTDKALTWASIFVFTGWLISEVGLFVSRAKLFIQILFRIPLYSYLFIFLCIAGIIHFLDSLNFP